MNEAIIAQIKQEIESKGLLTAEGTYIESEDTYYFHLREVGSPEPGTDSWVELREIAESQLNPSEAAALVLFRSMI